MELIRRKQAFIDLGQRLDNIDKTLFDSIVTKAAKNPWFSHENLKLSFKGLASYLKGENLEQWINQYKIEEGQPKKIGVVMAGNIPMVGIHDLICILISGQHLVAKLSSQDDVLIPFILDQLIEIEPGFKDSISIVDQLKNIDAVIATGSDNTSRYFDYYFSKYPNIIRKNRTSIAILNGNENQDDLQLLADDIFSYFGLGCRNVSKLFLPQGKKLDEIIPHFEKYSYIHDHTKYHNNYYYNKSILLVNQTEHLDSGYALFQESVSLSSPISVIYYEYYQDIEQLKTMLDPLKDKIQCIVTKMDQIESRIPYGKAQNPELWDYADNIDTMEFLLGLQD